MDEVTVQKLLKRHDLLHILGATFTLLEKACMLLGLDDIVINRCPMFPNETDDPIREYIESGMAQRVVTALGRHTSPFLPHLAEQREELLATREMLTTSRQPRRARQAAEAAMELQAREEERLQWKEWAEDETRNDAALKLSKQKKVVKPAQYRAEDHQPLTFIDDGSKDAHWKFILAHHLRARAAKQEKD